jgi:hypothetical protein
MSIVRAYGRFLACFLKIGLFSGRLPRKLAFSGLFHQIFGRFVGLLAKKSGRFWPFLIENLAVSAGWHLAALRDRATRWNRTGLLDWDEQS